MKCPVCNYACGAGRSTCGRPKCFEIYSWQWRGVTPVPTDGEHVPAVLFEGPNNEPPGNPDAADLFGEGG